MVRGEEARVRLVNDLPEPVALHWHGVRAGDLSAGTPLRAQPPIGPGESVDYRFACRDAGTFWYRTQSWPGNGRPCGLLLVDEPDRVTVDQDIALLLQQWSLGPDGHLAQTPAFDPASHHLTANGAPQVDIPVKVNERIRLRLVNAAASLMSVRIDGHRCLVMALDGQPAEPFVARDSRILLGPGNRADLIIDTTLAAGASASVTAETEKVRAEIARLLYEPGAPARAAPLADPAPLPANPLPSRMDFAGALRRDVAVEPKGPDATWPLRNPGLDRIAGRPLFAVRRSRTVMLALANRADTAAVLHLHGHAFRLLDRLDDGWKPYWLDTVVVPPQQTLRIAFVADTPGRWMIECGLLGSPHASKAAWFDVS